LAWGVAKTIGCRHNKILDGLLSRNSRKPLFMLKKFIGKDLKVFASARNCRIFFSLALNFQKNLIVHICLDFFGKPLFPQKKRKKSKKK
jgi:hypothetical protein